MDLNQLFEDPMVEFTFNKLLEDLVSISAHYLKVECSATFRGETVQLFHLSKHKLEKYPFDKNIVLLLRETILQSKENVALGKGPVSFWVLDEFDVAEYKGQNKVVIAKPDKTNPNPRLVLGCDQTFAIIKEAHLSNNHAGFMDMQRILMKEYFFHKVCLRFFLKICHICSKDENKTRETDFTEIQEKDTYEMQVNSMQEYITQENKTKEDSIQEDFIQNDSKRKDSDSNTKEDSILGLLKETPIQIPIEKSINVQNLNAKEQALDNITKKYTDDTTLQKAKFTKTCAIQKPNYFNFKDKKLLLNGKELKIKNCVLNNSGNEKKGESNTHNNIKASVVNASCPSKTIPIKLQKAQLGNVCSAPASMVTKSLPFSKISLEKDKSSESLAKFSSEEVSHSSSTYLPSIFPAKKSIMKNLTGSKTKSECNQSRRRRYDDISKYRIFRVELATNGMKAILILIDKSTKYIWLRPLHTKNLDELTIELYKIFTDFGTPSVLETLPYQKSIFDSARHLMSETLGLKPVFNVKITPTGPKISTHVQLLIEKWFSITNVENLIVACADLQMQFNSFQHRDPSPFGKKGPFYCMFKNKNSPYKTFSTQFDISILLETENDSDSTHTNIPEPTVPINVNFVDGYNRVFSITKSSVEPTLLTTENIKAIKSKRGQKRNHSKDNIHSENTAPKIVRIESLKQITDPAKSANVDNKGFTPENNTINSITETGEIVESEYGHFCKEKTVELPESDENTGSLIFENLSGRDGSVNNDNKTAPMEEPVKELNVEEFLIQTKELATEIKIDTSLVKFEDIKEIENTMTNIGEIHVKASNSDEDEDWHITEPVVRTFVPLGPFTFNDQVTEPKTELKLGADFFCHVCDQKIDNPVICQKCKKPVHFTETCARNKSLVKRNSLLFVKDDGNYVCQTCYV